MNAVWLQVFLRETEKLLLDEALHAAIMRRVIFIQRWVKACLERRYFLRLREATVALQVFHFCHI